jgi:hypothetical protein
MADLVGVQEEGDLNNIEGTANWETGKGSTPQCKRRTWKERSEESKDKGSLAS